MRHRSSAGCLAVVLLLLLCAQPVLGSPDAVTYEQYVTLIHDQDDHGGCIGQSANHILEILKEMEAPYTPDPSYGFHWYIYDAATTPGGDPRVADKSDENTYHMLATYGGPPETSYPTNFDIIGNDNAATLNHPPSDAAFSAAQAYRLMATTTVTNNPTIAQAEDLIANGPIVCEQLFPGHAVALIGYNRTAQEFTIVDSANWMNIGHAGIKRVPYSYFQSRQSSMFVTAVTNRATPLVDPYTARIRIRHDDLRSFLTVRIGAVGHDPVTVWSRNNRLNWTDYGQDLAIDVSLPSYAAACWPPSDQNQWYVQVTNADTDHDAHLQEVTLVRRHQDSPTLPVIADVYAQDTAPRTIPPGTSEIRCPQKITVTSPNGGEHWVPGRIQTVTFNQIGLSGTSVKIELVKGTTPMATIAASWPATAGSKDWQVPSTLASGSDYSIRVQSLADPAIGDSSNAPFTVDAQAAAFTAIPVSGLSPLTVHFTDTSNGNPTAWYWNFGDSQTSTTQSPSHSFANAGTYSVTLTVTYWDGAQRQITKQNLVTVYQALNAGYTVSSRIGYAPYTAEFTDQTAGNPNQWNWTFGDGGWSVAQNPTHTYQNAGTYTVVLTVSNPYDTKTATKSDYIRVLPLDNGLIKVQAENYDSGGEGVAYHDTTAGNSGTSLFPGDVDVMQFARGEYAIFDTAETEWTRYWVWSPAPTQESFPISLRVANTVLGRRMEIGVDGIAGTVSLTPPKTVSSTTFTKVNTTITLKPGANELRMYFRGDGITFDYFTINPSSVQSIMTVPGGAGIPTETNADGLCDDVNGNGRKDFADVVLYFNQMAWIAANEPVAAFDYNGNGRIDFADVVWLFNNL
jgi:PKD repeat protein